MYPATSYVEQGRNPDIFTRSFIERAAGENQYTNGKIQAVSVRSSWHIFQGLNLSQWDTIFIAVPFPKGIS
jgi:hypothetical protein